MKLHASTRHRLERLITRPGEELGRWTRMVRFQVDLWGACARRLRENNVMAMSAALSFRTILAIIPTLVLAFLVLRATGAIDRSRDHLHTFLDSVGLATITVSGESPLPAVGPPLPLDAEPAPSAPVNLADEIVGLVDSVEQQLTVGKLGLPGIALLVWSSLTLLTTMERSLNRIFGARSARALWSRVLLYWSVITLGPLILGVASYIAERGAQTAHNWPVIGWMLTTLGWFAPTLVAVLLLAMLYKLMPNTSVRPQSALVGAIVAVPLWLLAKWALALYVSRLGGSLYGALGLLPVFLMWLSLSWWIFLFGAQFAHTATHLQHYQALALAERIAIGPLDVLAVSTAVARPFLCGGPPIDVAAIGEQVNLPDESVQRMLDRLVEIGVVLPTGTEDDTAYVLARPPQRIGISELLELTGEHQAPRLREIDPVIRAAVARVQKRASAESTTLADILAEDAS